MADAREAWNTTGEKLTELGRKLKVHYDTQRGEDAQASRQEIADAARKVGGALQDAFEAIGAAARDSSVQADVKQVGQSLVEALGATLGQASDEVKRALSERKGEAAGRRPAPEAQPGTAPPPVEPRSDGEGSENGNGNGKVEPWGTP
jgi:hypothetical protein